MENDLISRSALITHIGDLGIDPEDDTTFLTTGQACAIAHKCIVAMVKEEPAVDAVEVVRCKDCKHKKHLQGARDEAIVCGLGWGLSGIVAEEDFCSYGKRRADDGE